MKINHVTVTRGKRVKLLNDESEKYEISMGAIIEDKDDPQVILQGLKTILDKHISSWEKNILEKETNEDIYTDVIIKTADELISEDSTNIINKNDPDIEEKENENSFDINLTLICPKCNELMVKKEGKDYFLCSKHWGYPDMIKSGQVREKRF
jgi:hypothetical protein